jgi:serine/threonine protein kinase
MLAEQARGKAVDKRADIWAFGVVLCEMLTGGPLFTGETVSDTLAAVLTWEPDGDPVPAKAQRLLRRHRCDAPARPRGKRRKGRGKARFLTCSAIGTGSSAVSRRRSLKSCAIRDPSRMKGRCPGGLPRLRA